MLAAELLCGRAAGRQSWGRCPHPVPPHLLSLAPDTAITIWYGMETHSTSPGMECRFLLWTAGRRGGAWGRCNGDLSSETECCCSSSSLSGTSAGTFSVSELSPVQPTYSSHSSANRWNYVPESLSHSELR